MRHHAITIALIISALALYAAGWSTGADALLAAGSLCELVLWSRLLRAQGKAATRAGAA